MDNYNELAERRSFSGSNAPLIVDDSLPIVLPNSMRRCQDIACAVIFLAFVAAFIALLIYGLVSGSFLAVFSMYNVDDKQCNTYDNYYYGYMTNYTTLSNAVCVDHCPNKGEEVFCLQQATLCPNGVYVGQYDSIPVDSYCVPSNISDINIQALFGPDPYQQWLYDSKTAWILLAVAIGIAIILSLLFLVLVRCCALAVIWVSIVLAVGGMIVIGIFFILTAKGIVIDDYIWDRLSDFSYDALVIVGSILLGMAFFLLILVICLHSRIVMGARAVELGALFLFDNFCMVLMPVTLSFLAHILIIAVVIGAGYLYSLGTITFPGHQAFPHIDLDGGDIAMIVFFFAGGLWITFFIYGCYQYILCSSVAIWYFNGSDGYQNAPCTQSLVRLLRFNFGSVAFTSVINALFFLIKWIAHIFSFDQAQNDTSMVQCCIRCMGALFCMCKMCLRFLTDGAYVQMAITGAGYCESTGKAFELIMNNAIRIGITDGISVFFTVVGILGVTATVGVLSYFAVVYIPYYKTRIGSPFPVVFLAATTGTTVAVLYLSMIDLCSASVLQCFLTDRSRHRGRIQYANEEVRRVLRV